MLLHEPARLRFDGQSEPRHELHAPQHPEWILDEGILTVDPEHPIAEIPHPAERIDEAILSYLESHRVDRVVSPFEIGLYRDTGIVPDVEIPVMLAGRDLRPRERYVDRLIPRCIELYDTKGLTNEMRPPEWFEQRDERLVLDPAYDIIRVGGIERASEGDITNGPSDEIEAPPAQNRALPCVERPSQSYALLIIHY